MIKMSKQMFMWMRCLILGHSYVKETIYSENVERWQCVKCNKLFGVNHDGIIILPWDNELQHFTDTYYKQPAKENKEVD